MVAEGHSLRPSAFCDKTSSRKRFWQGEGGPDLDVGGLQRLLAGFGVDATEGQCSLLLEHLELVVERNRTLNLTRIESVEEGTVLHVLDSLLPLPALRGLVGQGDQSFVDLGTGAGFPGIPVGVVTGWEGTLIDSVGKKVGAVADFLGKLSLDGALRAEHLRAEDLARRDGTVYDVVLARAVAQTGVLLELSSPLLVRGGYLVAYKGHPTDRELSVADACAELVGMRNVSRETFELPDGFGHREVLIYEKIGTSHVSLPRRNGMAKREPLGV